MVSVAELKTDESEFHTSYRIFIDAVQMLASSPEDQCAAMGDFNVAWELKDDVRAGKYLVGQGYLNEVQEAWVLALAGALDAVPAQVLPAGAGRETNLLGMKHPSWVPLRVIANVVLDALRPFTEQNAKYLQLPWPAG
ncbi:hypothetical protein AcdelDRAFT_1891 [Acidovorax delafieldii 2AN]|uniref:Uncharacterized protein n=1 Tax=Acidovorax delafieldii 2AN TaxID=573060 RepID=C5T4R1_ACIDE|nr:hypothetical protein [Acidovorax delafieldii]EER60554.1 hypothetical protein AcdelDRAFT_1891 [Acidovorax delafieldii 2AN]